MNIGIDIDGTLTRYPEFFVELGRAWRKAGHRVFIITGLGHKSALEKLQAVELKFGGDFYDALVDTSLYDDTERLLIGKVTHNEAIVGQFKQRKCRELGVAIMFDDMARIHRFFGDIPIFEVK